MNAVVPSSGTQLQVGEFVRATSNHYGVGKLARYGAQCEVEYFTALEPERRIRIEVSRRHVRPVVVEPGTSCFWQDGVRWQTGKLEVVGRRRCRIRSHSEKVIGLRIEDVFVRGALAIGSPVELLGAHLTGTVADHAARRNWIVCSLAQRAAARGLDGIGSAGARLHTHQLEVARQVLLDPLQRFLLGDEVGLGKTIEAGFVIRQLLVEDQHARVVILAPAALLPQWREELAEKFGISQFPGAEIRLHALERPKEWAAVAEVDLLVVDEAHKVTAHPAQPAFQALSPLTTRTPRVLLLSATPAIHHEQAFIGLLHLLEPAIYRLNDLDGLKQRLERRAELSRAILTFRPEQPNFHLRAALRQLCDTFPDDPRLTELSARTEPLLGVEADVDSSGRAAAIDAVRVHVSETYRLHRRLLRTRRIDAWESGTMVRGRTDPEEFLEGAGDLEDVQDLFDAWRATLADTALEAGNVEATAALLPLFLTRAGSDFELLQALVRFRLRRDQAQARRALITARTAQRIVAIGVGTAERDVLRDLEASLARMEFNPRVRATEAAVGSVLDAKIVVFTGYAPVARKVAAYLSDLHGDERVAVVTRPSDDATRAGELKRFRTDPACAILIGDPVAQEGVNLQFADRLVHLDLPWIPNSLEQRIGRLDRYGDDDPFESVVLLDGGPNLTFPDAWYRCLRDGFGVFRRSIAGFQFVLDRVMRDIRRRALVEGVPGILAVASELPARLDAELAEIEERESLDSLQPGPEARAFVNELLSADEQSDGLLDAFDRARHVVGVTRERYLATPEVFGLREDAGDNAPEGLGDRQFTVAREAAVKHPGAELLRPGHPVFEDLDRRIAGSDRGRAFAARRNVRGWRENDALFWRLDFVVGAESREAAEDMRPALERRVAWHFADRPVTVWLDIAAHRVDEAVHALLDGSLSDSSLDLSGSWPLEPFLAEGEWRAACCRAEEEGRRAALADQEIVNALGAGRVAAAAALRTAEQQNAARRYADRGTRSIDDTPEIELRRAVVEALDRPLARLDALGVVVVSGVS